MNNILDEVLGHIRLVRNNKQKLKKILDFILDEIYVEKEEEVLEIPKEFEKLLNSTAQSIDCGQIVYINLDTMQVEEVVPDMEDQEDYELNYNDCSWATKPEFYNWENSIRFAPLESHDSFKIMETFTYQIDDSKSQNQLLLALNNRKPFANFKWKIDNSPYRQDWFIFKQNWLEGHVREIIWSQLNTMK